MARIASQSKGGFYPTPIEELQLITPHLAIQYSEQEHIINALDPCCGKGEALDILAKSIRKRGQSDVYTYGIELEETRYETASSVLDHVIHDSFENARMESKYSLLWLNPPYDEYQNERTELRFLKLLTSAKKNVLQPGGLLMFCIPQHVLKDCAPILAQRFKDIRVYRFTDEHFYVFDQVVVFAYFKKPTYKETREAADALRKLAVVEPIEIPTLEEIEEGFIIPSYSEEVQVFRAGKLNIKEVAKDIQTSTVFQEFEKRINQQGKTAVMQRPLLPLKSTHMAIAIASGAVSGNLGNHIVTGITKKQTHVAPHKNEEGTIIGEQVTRFYSSAVRIFTPNGVYELSDKKKESEA